jgi:hypothetical protein
LLKIIKNFLFKHPKKGFIYAVVTGTYAGQLFVFIETDKEDHCFLSLPQMVNRKVPISKFELGLKNKIVETVERLPKQIHNICTKQYRKNSNIT